MKLAQDIEVELHFLPTDRGGNSNPVRSGYRPQFFYRGQDWDAEHTYIDRDEVLPGESVRAYLTFMSPQLHVGHVAEGMPFLVREGHRTVAYGRVLRILDLLASAEQASRQGGQDRQAGTAT
jgi:elongation factor Tu